MPRWRLLRPGYLGTEADRATFRTLHTATQMTSELRTGLTQASAERCVRHLARLLGAQAVAVTDTTDTLAWQGRGQVHLPLVGALAERCVPRAPPPSATTATSPAASRDAPSGRRSSRRSPSRTPWSAR